MDRACAGRTGRFEDRLDVQVAFRRGGPADADSVIRIDDKGGVAISLGKHRHAFQSQFATATLDPAGNFTPVCDQDTGKGHFTRQDGTPLLMKLLIPSMPSSVSQASASRSAV